MTYSGREPPGEKRLGEVRGAMPTTLAIDFGSRYVGIALVDHPEPRRNRVLYAATVVIDSKPLNALVETRAQVRRLRRTRKTHRRRLHRLAQALHGIPNSDVILRFCRRRGYSYQESDSEDETAQSFQFHRSTFFDALRLEIARLIDPIHQARVLRACSKHLNEDCRREAELRPARFENRGPTVCNWEGCTRHVPRADHAVRERLRQSLVAWLLPVLSGCEDRVRFLGQVDQWVGRLDVLSSRHHRAADAEGRKPINSEITRAYRGLLADIRAVASPEVGEKFSEDWQRHYRKALGIILRGEQGGRVRYCRIHSEEFVTFLVAGKAIPNRQDIEEGDLVSRKQQIVFRRLWRLVESRMLHSDRGTD